MTVDPRALSRSSPSPPGVAVVVPTYNARRFVGLAIRSALAQTARPVQLIAVDDGSTDGTAEYLAGVAERVAGDIPAFDLVRQPNRGSAAARNRGIERCRAPLVAFLDADDVWHPMLIEKALSVLEARPEVDLVFPWVRYIDERGEPTGAVGRPRGGAFQLGDILVENPIHTTSGVVARRQALERAGGFDEALASNVDYDLWLRMVADGAPNAVCLPEPLVDYRRRSGQVTCDWRRMHANWQIVMAKARRRHPELVAAVERRAAARYRLFCASLAIEAGNDADLRALMLEAWRAAPRDMLRARYAGLRTVAALLTYLPRPVRTAAHSAWRRLERARA